ncbi:aminotransferase class IV [Virgisporangium aurantiacum]|nr:aminotransferase class IV [Virgisporangium aurantiacum]
MTHATVNGVPASADDLVPLAFAGYGHYTSMQMRAGRVRGFGFHLDRLRVASLELFGVAVPDERVRECVRATVTGDASVVVHMFVGDWAAFEAGRPVEPSVLVRTRAPAEPSETPVRVRTARFGRYLPHIKNAATMGLVHHHRHAVIDGYDDALFVDDDGVISEGSAWNVLFLDADGTTVFPVAPMLLGTMLQMIRTRFTGPVTDRAVGVINLPDLRGAALTNSINPARPISAVDGREFPVDDEWLGRLRAAYADNVPEAV